MEFDQAVGFTVNQYLFARSVTQTMLAKKLGITYPGVSNRLRGRIKWTAADLAVTANMFGVEVADLYPTRSGEGWAPAAYVPGMQKAPVPVGTEASGSGVVAGTGFEPATSGLQVHGLASWTRWLAHGAIVALEYTTLRRFYNQRFISTPYIT